MEVKSSKSTNLSSSGKECGYCGFISQDIVLCNKCQFNNNFMCFDCYILIFKIINEVVDKTNIKPNFYFSCFSCNNPLDKNLALSINTKISQNIALNQNRMNLCFYCRNEFNEESQKFKSKIFKIHDDCFIKSSLLVLQKRL